MNKENVDKQSISNLAGQLEECVLAINNELENAKVLLMKIYAEVGEDESTD